MAVCEHGADANGREPVFVPEVAVGEEECFAAGVHERVVGHHREVEKKLVHLRVAVAAHGHDLLLQSVENSRHLLGIVERGHAVARPMVQKVAEKRDPVEPERCRHRKRALERGRHAVYVAEKQNPHL